MKAKNKSVIFMSVILIISFSTFCACMNPPDKTAKGDNGCISDPYESVTPYQFLNLILSNAENITFEYTLYFHETGITETGAFYRSMDKCAAVFTALDDADVRVKIREVEADGRVLYIMENSGTVKNYPGPAEDFILYRMLSAASSTHEGNESYEKDGYIVYEYNAVSGEADGVRLSYDFYMENGILKKLTFSADGFLQQTYDFSDFRQDTIDAELFERPEGYREEVFDYPCSTENIPPWWETDGMA